MSDLWARLPDEPDNAWSSFQVYCMQLTPIRSGGRRRTLAETSRRTGFHITTIKIWNAKFNWAERARAYDNAVDLEGQLIIYNDIKAAQASHIDNMTGATAVLVELLGAQAQQLQRLIQSGDMPLSDSVDAAKALMSAYDKLDVIQRRTLGLPSNYKSAEPGQVMIEDDEQVYVVKSVGEKKHDTETEDDILKYLSGTNEGE